MFDAAVSLQFEWPISDASAEAATTAKTAAATSATTELDKRVGGGIGYPGYDRGMRGSGGYKMILVDRIGTVLLMPALALALLADPAYIGVVAVAPWLLLRGLDFIVTGRVRGRDGQ